MNNFVSPHQDFFIYIPSRPARQQHACISVQPDGNGEGFHLPARYTDWVKIPLAETFVVYAHMLEEQDAQDKQAACHSV